MCPCSRIDTYQVYCLGFTVEVEHYQYLVVALLTHVSQHVVVGSIAILGIDIADASLRGAVVVQGRMGVLQLNQLFYE